MVVGVQGRGRGAGPPALSSARAATPWSTRALIAANLVVFGFELALGHQTSSIIQRWGLVPAEVSPVLRQPLAVPAAALITLLSSTFLHSSWLHLLTNMLYLGVFGGAVEARLGHGRFLVLYALCAIAAGVAYVLAQPSLSQVAVGASGAVSGMIAANLVLFPGATVGLLMPMVFFRRVESAPALLLLALWVVLQALAGIASVSAPGGAPIWAHLGGFASGIVLAPLLRPARRASW